MFDKKIGFVGIGNMGSPMIKALVESGKVTAEELTFFDIDKARAKILAAEIGKTGYEPFENVREMAKDCDLIIIAVKPNVCKLVLHEIKDVFTNDKMIVSIVAGMPIAAFLEILGEDARVIRTMPNTPCQINEGVTLLSKGANVCDEDFAEIIALFQCFGMAEELPEKMMNEVIAVTSSSPAYVFMFIEAMADAAVQSGIPRGLAYKLAAQAVQGSARLVLETGKHPGELKDAVCSPAGTTIEAVNKLEEKGFRSAVIEAMKACTDKARKISEKN